MKHLPSIGSGKANCQRIILESSSKNPVTLTFKARELAIGLITSPRTKKKLDKERSEKEIGVKNEKKGLLE